MDPVGGRKLLVHAAVQPSEASVPQPGKAPAGGGGFLAAIAVFFGFSNKCAQLLARVSVVSVLRVFSVRAS